MSTPAKAAILALATLTAFAVLDGAAAAPRSPGEAAFWGGLGSGGSSGQKGSRSRKASQIEPMMTPAAPKDLERAARTERPVRVPRGSSTYIPPPMPSPYSVNSPPAPALTQPTVQPYVPPPITTFSDRVNSAIQAYPLERGIGNNPTDQQQFIRQRLNQ